MGPREFVAYPHEDLTIANIKLACFKHFAAKICAGMVCNVLAGDQGPSCRTMEQLPSTKVIHIRFVEGEDVEVEEELTDNAEDVTSKKPRVVYSPIKSLPTGSTTNFKRPQKVYPKSLSVSTILNLGKTINDTSTLIEILSFDLEEMPWPKCGERIEFCIEKEPFASGGFRQAFKAFSKSGTFKGKEWVVKKYLPATLSVIEQMSETTETHTKKVVQMHSLARNMAANLQLAVKRLNKEKEFGDSLYYNDIFLGKTDDEFVTVEEFVSGDFVKYVNNTGKRYVGINDKLADKAECLAHFSYTKSENKLMILDIQGSGCYLYDPEIASADLLECGKVLFCAGNLSSTAINCFKNEHICNKYCQLLNLPRL